MESSRNGTPHPDDYSIYDVYDIRAMLRGHRNRIEAAMHDTGPINGCPDPKRKDFLAAIIADSQQHVQAIERVLGVHRGSSTSLRGA